MPGRGGDGKEVKAAFEMEREAFRKVDFICMCHFLSFIAFLWQTSHNSITCGAEMAAVYDVTFCPIPSLQLLQEE